MMGENVANAVIRARRLLARVLRAACMAALPPVDRAIARQLDEAAADWLERRL